jgi:hypothetical protein
MLFELSEKTKLFDSIKWPKLLKVKALKAVACRLNSVALLTIIKAPQYFSLKMGMRAHKNLK